MKYKAAIHMTSYNKGKYTIEAIDSVLSQTAEFPFILYIQENSFDETREFVRNKCSGNNRIVLIDGDNNIGSSKNDFYQNFDADYLFQMDGDDLLLPEFLEEMVSVLEVGNEAVYCSIAHIRLDGSREVYPAEYTFPNSIKRLSGSVEPFQVGLSKKAIEKMPKPICESYNPEVLVEALHNVYYFMDNIEATLRLEPVPKILYIHRTTKLSQYNKI